MSDETWTILVVDDKEINIKILDKILKNKGFQVIQALDGSQAREVARIQQPDLILMDIVMPGESGFETCETLKDDPLTADIPVIFLSALEDVQNKVRGFQAGGVDYVTKPFQQEEILVRVKTHLKLRHAYQRIIQEQARRLKQIQEAQKEILVDPSHEPEAKYEVSYLPNLEAGGDFYDVFHVGPDSFAYFLGDICGHDLRASFATSALKALVRENVNTLYTLEESMQQINRVLSSVLSPGVYLTAIAMIIERDKKKANLISAGHPPAIYVPYSQEARIVETEGDVIGAFEQVSFHSEDFSVREGDRFFLYSDGLIESISEDKDRQEGLLRLCRSCSQCRDKDIQLSVRDIVQDMLAGQKRTPSGDDVVLLGVEV